MRNNELSSMLYQRYNVPRNSVIASRELLSSPRERGAGGGGGTHKIERKEVAELNGGS